MLSQVTPRRYSMGKQRTELLLVSLFSFFNVSPAESGFYFLVVRLERSIRRRVGIGRTPRWCRHGIERRAYPSFTSLLPCTLVGFDPDAGILPSRTDGSLAFSLSFPPVCFCIDCGAGESRAHRIAQDRACQFVSAYILR